MNLYGPVRADKNVGAGKASVTLSMEWKGMPVASTTHAVQVLDAPVLKELPVSSRLVRSLPHPDRSAVVHDVRFTPKGTLFTAGYPSGVVQLWDPATGKVSRRIERPKGGHSTLNYASSSADFGTLFVTTDGRKVILSKDESKQRSRIEYHGKILAWDLATGKPKPALKGQPDYGASAAYLSPDGTRLITTERPGRTLGLPARPDVVRMTDTATGRSWKLAEGIGIAAFPPDSKLAYVSVQGFDEKAESGLLVFDREGKELRAFVRQTKGGSFAPTLSPDGKWLAADVDKGRIDQPGSLQVIDLTTGKAVAEFASGGDFPFLGATFSPDGKLVAAGDCKGRMRVFDVAKRSVVLEHGVEGWRLGRSVAFSRDGLRLAVSSGVKPESRGTRTPDPLESPQPRIYLFDLTKPKLAPDVIVCPHGWMGGVAFSADGKTLAFGSAGAVHLFDVSGLAK